mmetsp:Transcript_33688/g.105038  ORF Transcript_33688/g.105038 Transcript_33688/m.105038 type:complete len:248 (+) Transcript_33688:170-913(+)
MGGRAERRRGGVRPTAAALGGSVAAPMAAAARPRGGGAGAWTAKLDAGRPEGGVPPRLRQAPQVLACAAADVLARLQCARLPRGILRPCETGLSLCVAEDAHVRRDLVVKAAVATAPEGALRPRRLVAQGRRCAERGLSGGGLAASGGRILAPGIVRGARGVLALRRRRCRQTVRGALRVVLGAGRGGSRHTCLPRAGGAPRSWERQRARGGLGDFGLRPAVEGPRTVVGVSTLCRHRRQGTARNGR